MLELLVLSVCINIFILGFMYTKTNKIMELNDIIISMSDRYIDTNNKLNKAISRKKYSTHRSWFADKFNDQEFDDIIDMLLFQYITDYTYGDVIEYPTLEAEDISNEGLEEIHTAEAEYAADDIPAFLDDTTNGILDEIGYEEIPAEVLDNNITEDFKPDFEKAHEVLKEIIPGPTYVESSYERSTPSSSSSYSDNSSSDSSSSDSSSSDSSSD